MHDRHIIHADIRPENILLRRPMQASSSSKPYCGVALVDMGNCVCLFSFASVCVCSYFPHVCSSHHPQRNQYFPRCCSSMLPPIFCRARTTYRLPDIVPPKLCCDAASAKTSMFGV
jgi:serine/threonine protein kinase